MHQNGLARIRGLASHLHGASTHCMHLPAAVYAASLCKVCCAGERARHAVATGRLQPDSRGDFSSRRAKRLTVAAHVRMSLGWVLRTYMCRCESAGRKKNTAACAKSPDTAGLESGASEKNDRRTEELLARLVPFQPQFNTARAWGSCARRERNDRFCATAGLSNAAVLNWG